MLSVIVVIILGAILLKCVMLETTLGHIVAIICALIMLWLAGGGYKCLM